MKRALFYENVGKNVKCSLCARNCLIRENSVGFCKVRKNISGKLYSLVYGKLCSLAVDPVEKKPMYMFAPSSKTLSVSSVGCNFKCQFCCNWHISQEALPSGREFTPEELVDIAKKENVDGISYTYVEPTVFFEFAYDTAKIASSNGLFNNFVTNGYTNPKAIEMISPYLDAATVDFRASGNLEFYKKYSKVNNVKPVYDALIAYRKNNIHLEITNLLVPRVGDSMVDLKKLCSWIVENLGNNVPFHILQFFPTQRMENYPRTPVKTLENAYNVAKECGLKYVYLGNVHNHILESTYCPNCKELLIERSIFGVRNNFLKKDKKCPKCGEKIPIKGSKWVPSTLWK